MDFVPCASMNKYNDKYLQLGNGIIKIKECHDQMARAVCLVEIDDYCGDFYSHLVNHWFLNNNNIITEFSFMALKSLKEVTIKEFQELLLKQIDRCVNEIKIGNSCPLLFFKKTDVRINTLRKYYGTKP